MSPIELLILILLCIVVFLGAVIIIVDQIIDLIISWRKKNYHALIITDYGSDKDFFKLFDTYKKDDISYTILEIISVKSVVIKNRVVIYKYKMLITSGHSINNGYYLYHVGLKHKEGESR